ncbi:MAG: L-histidine N(alpha)-methyltransferase [Myxococcota bacterium]
MNYIQVDPDRRARRFYSEHRSPVSSEAPGHVQYRVLNSAELLGLHRGKREFAHEILTGLAGVPKRLASKYFYDDTGSRLFRQIMTLPEYYLTRCEREILCEHGADILGHLRGRSVNLVDLGAGDGTKTLLIADRASEADVDLRYVPIDISKGAMEGLIERVEQTRPGLRCCGLVSEYIDGVHWLGAQQDSRAHLVLLLGSNIGNFDRAQSRDFLRRLWSAMRDQDYLLIGFDLKKDIDLMQRAYNDDQGITRAFNLNLLERINRELGGHFDPEKFQHFAPYNIHAGAMESYLVSVEAQEVFVEALEQKFEFAPWEPIQTECSYKFLMSDVESLARETGFSIVSNYYDRKGWFVNSLWRVVKSKTP